MSHRRLAFLLLRWASTRRIPWRRVQSSSALSPPLLMFCPSFSLQEVLSPNSSMATRASAVFARRRLVSVRRRLRTRSRCGSSSTLSSGKFDCQQSVYLTLKRSLAGRGIPLSQLALSGSIGA